MSINAKGVKSTRKKDLATQRTPFTAFKSFSFAHEATAGETTISLTGLNTPTSYAAMGFLQPSASDLSAANLLLYKRNLRLHSTLRGVLLEYDAYNIAGSLTINLNFEAEEGEIFVGVISDVAKSGLQVIDGKSLVSTGTLAAGETDYVVGQAFSLNKYPLAQVGDVLVFLDGQLMFRNTDNAAAAVDADGNYEEVDGGQGLSNTIRFNTVDPDNDRAVMVVSNGMLAERPHASLRAEIETLAGQVDALAETVAALAGVERTAFQSAPNSVDLQTFGQRVIDLENATPDAAGNGTPGTISSEYVSPEGDLGTITIGTGTWSAIDSKKYKWHRLGKQVTFWYRVESTTSASGLVSFSFPLPADCPAPSPLSNAGTNEWTGFGGVANSAPSLGGSEVLGSCNIFNGGGINTVYHTQPSSASKLCWGSLTYLTA